MKDLMLFVVALAAGLPAQSTTVNNYSAVVSVNDDGPSGSRACGASCVPGIAEVRDTVPTGRIVLRPSIWAPCSSTESGQHAYFLCLGTPSPVPIPIPGLCGDLLLWPDPFAISPEWFFTALLGDPRSGWHLDVGRFPPGASISMQVLSVEHDCLYGSCTFVRLDSLSDRYVMTRL